MKFIILCSFFMVYWTNFYVHMHGILKCLYMLTRYSILSHSRFTSASYEDYFLSSIIMSIPISLGVGWSRQRRDVGLATFEFSHTESSEHVGWDQSKQTFPSTYPSRLGWVFPSWWRYPRRFTLSMQMNFISLQFNHSCRFVYSFILEMCLSI